MILVLERVNIAIGLLLSPIADFFVELRTNFGLVILPSRRVRGVNSNTVQLVLNVASPVKTAL